MKKQKNEKMKKFYFCQDQEGTKGEQLDLLNAMHLMHIFL